MIKLHPSIKAYRLTLPVALAPLEIHKDSVISSETARCLALIHAMRGEKKLAQYYLDQADQWMVGNT